MSRKKIYFASDFHLGAPDRESSLIREKRVVKWLNTIMADASELYLMGDIFDFWFEYRHTVPKGYIRLLGTLAALADAGIVLHIFTGNHDLWLQHYLKEELGAIIYYGPVVKEIDGRTFYLAHGDGLGPGDHGFKFIKRIFTNPFCQWLFARIHPNTGIGLASFLSRRSRAKTGSSDARYLGEDKEWLILHSKEVLLTRHVDYFIYGHRHYPLLLALSDKSIYLNLGDWITYNTYAVWDGESLELEYFEKEADSNTQ